ncbi:MAG: hypothetical protein KDC95_02985 [Planctomycetes bacterium]|nr:hypothetical protein [Planctomycetota bacterium]
MAHNHAIGSAVATLLMTATVIAQCPPASIHIGKDRQEVGFDIAADYNCAVFGQYFGTSAQIHELAPSGSWTRVASITSKSPTAKAVGRNVAIGGGTAVAADPLDSQNVASITIAERSSSGWTTVATFGSPRRHVGFGNALAVSRDGTLIAVGNPAYNDDRGIAYVYRKTAQGWTHDGTLSPKLAPSPQDFFGINFAFDGQKLLVGAMGTNSYAGSVYVFDKVGSTWTEIASFTEKSPSATSFFGSTLQLDGNRLIASTKDNVLEFARSGSTWTEVGTIVKGQALQISLMGSRLATGTYGRVEVFDAGATGWTKIASFGYPDGFLSQAQFGPRLALTQTGLLVSAPTWDNDIKVAPSVMGAVCYYDLEDLGKPLVACGHGIHAQYGGSQRLLLDAPALAGQPYLVLGSLTGKGPLRVGNVSIPLDYDPYLEFTAAIPNSSFLPRGFGVLDARGSAATDFVLPTPFARYLLGHKLHHAFVTLGATGLTSASNAVTIEVGL